MDAWDKWTVGENDGQMERWRNGGMKGFMDGGMDGCMHRRMERQLRRMDGEMGGRMHERMDRWRVGGMDEQTKATGRGGLKDGHTD